MKLVLSNTGPNPVPVTGDGFAEILKPGDAKTLDYPASVWLIGDKASILENIGKSFKIIADFLLQRKPAAGETITVTVTNSGPKSVRVVPGNVQNEATVAPLGIVPVTGTEYIELRELGY